LTRCEAVKEVKGIKALVDEYKQEGWLYCKQVARQHFVVDCVKFVLTSSLITVQKLVAVSHTVCAHV